MERTINIGGRDVTLKVSGASPFIYRNATGKDLIRDIETLVDSVKSGDSDAWHEIIERVVYQFAKQADKSIGTIEEFLDSFDSIADIYRTLSDVLILWNENLATTSEEKN